MRFWRRTGLPVNATAGAKTTAAAKTTPRAQTTPRRRTVAWCFGLAAAFAGVNVASVVMAEAYSPKWISLAVGMLALGLWTAVFGEPEDAGNVSPVSMSGLLVATCCALAALIAAELYAAL